MFFSRILAPTVGAKDGTLTLRAVTPVRPEQVVTCSAHSNEHFKTNLAEYWGGGGKRGGGRVVGKGCTIGQVTSRTIARAPVRSNRDRAWPPPYCGGWPFRARPCVLTMGDRASRSQNSV